MNTQQTLAAPATIVIKPEEGTTYMAFGDVMQVKLGQAQVGGSLNVCLNTTPPGGGAPPHRHCREDEWFLILEGRYNFLANGAWSEVGPGTVIYSPHGDIHGFQNIGDTPSRMWAMTNSCVLETFFRECAAALAAQAGPPDVQRLQDIAAENGVEFIAPPLRGTDVAEQHENSSMTAQPSAASAATVVVKPEEGPTLQAFGDTLQVKLGQEQTNGSLSVSLATIPPDCGPPPHRHRCEDEMFLVLEGRMAFLANGEWVEAEPGSVVYSPRGVVHTFNNIGDAPARMWILTTPCGFESFFSKCADVWAEAGAGPPDMGRILEISTEHGIEYVPALA